MVSQPADIISDLMARVRPRYYTTGTRRQVTPEWIASVRGALHERGKGLRWLETEAGLAKGAATKILDGQQQTSNHVDAISKALGLTVTATVVETADEIELLTMFRKLSPDGRAHLLGLLGALQKPRT
jgi:hypothetical protein